MAFIIKQNDTLPYLYFQFFEPDAVTPLDLTGAAVSLVMRKVGAVPEAAPALKKACVVSSPLEGIGYYQWDAADTAESGDFEYEFEIVWGDGGVQTIPADAYFKLTVVDDIG
jgi:hypothetical protein